MALKQQLDLELLTALDSHERPDLLLPLLLQLCALSVEEALAVHPFDHIAPCPAHRVRDLVVFDYLAPMAAAAFGAEQFLQPFIAQHQHWLGVDNQFRFFRFHPTLLQLVRLQQM